MSQEEPVEALFRRRSRAASTLKKSVGERQQPPFTIGTKGADLQTIKQCVETDLDFVIDLHRRSTTADFIDKVKNDNILLLKTNQELRALIAELQERLREKEDETNSGNKPKIKDEIEELHAKNDQLQDSYARLGKDYAQLLCDNNAKISTEQHFQKISELQRKLVCEERRALEAEKEVRKLQEEIIVPDCSGETNFFLPRSEMLEEIRHLRSELITTKEQIKTTKLDFQAQLAKKNELLGHLKEENSRNFFSKEDKIIQSLRKECEELRKTNNELGKRLKFIEKDNDRLKFSLTKSDSTISSNIFSHTSFVTDVNSLRVENNNLRGNIQAISNMNSRNITEIMRLKLIVGDSEAKKIHKN